MPRTRSSGWYVEFAVPDSTSDRIVRPDVLDDGSWKPMVLGRPQAELSVPYSESKLEFYESVRETGSNVAIWKDGIRLPIDRLDDVSPDLSSETITLRLTGGRQLERFRSIQVDEEESHTVAGDLLTAETDYATDIDTPDTTVRERIRLYQALNNEDWQELLAAELDGGAFPDDVPLEISNGELQVLRTTHFEEAEDGDYQGSLSTLDDRYSGERAIEMASAGDYVEIDPNGFHAYTIPQGKYIFEWLWAIDAPSDHTVEVDFEIQGPDTVPVNYTINGSGGQFETSWTTEDAINTNSGAESGSIDSVRFEMLSPAYDQDADEEVSVYVDGLILDDTRYDTGRDADPDDQGRLSLPRSAPSIDLETIDLTPIERVVAGKIEIDANGTSSETGLALSNDGGDTWPIAATDTEVADGDFAEASNTLRARITVGTYEDEDSTPVDSPLLGRNRQAIDIATLFADLEDMPVVLSELFEGRIEETITSVFSDADMVWELRRDSDASPDDRDGLVVSASQTGQRERTSRAQVVDVSGRRTIEGSYERVIVEGRSEEVDEIERSGQSAGSGVSIGEQHIVTGSETITSTDGETTFVRGEDYDLDYETGVLTVLAGGDMVNEPFLASYEWKVRSQYPSEQDLTDAGITNPRTLKEQAASAATDRQCGQLALLTYNQVKETLEEVQVTMVAERPDASLIAALDHPDIPFDSVQITDAEFDAGEIRLTAQSRQSASEIFGRLQSQLDEVARQV